MDAVRPGLSSPVDDRLRQALALGEDVLHLAQHAAANHWAAEEMLQAQRRLIVDTAARLLGGKASLWLSDDVMRQWTDQSPAAPRSKKASKRLSRLMRYTMRQQKPAFSESIHSADFRRLEEFDEHTQADVIAAPMLIRDRLAGKANLLGVIQVERSLVPAFNRLDLELLEMLAIQAALALQASLQIAIEQWRLQQLQLVRQVTLQIVDLRDLDQIAQHITRLIQETFRYYSVAIFTVEAGERMLKFRAMAGPLNHQEQQESIATPSLTVRIGEGLIGYVAQTGQEIVAGDVRSEPLYRHLDALPGTRSEAVLPLKFHDRILGVLDVQSDQLDDFNDTDMLVLRALASNIAMAVEDARLYHALRQRASQLEMLYQVSSAITSILDQETLLNEVVELIQQRFGYPYVHLFTVHTGRRKIFYEAGSGPRSRALREQNFAYDLDDPQGIIPWVARHGEAVLTNDVNQEPRYRPSQLPPDETQAELCVPLIFGDTVLGVLDIQSDQRNAFSQDDLFLFEALADHIAVALRNAYLYRSETWRRTTTESLREVAGLLSADVDLDQVLQAILAVLARTLPLDVAAIWLTDHNGEEDSAQSSVLHLAAVQGEGTADLDWEIGLTPEDVLECNLSESSVLKTDNASVWLQEALQSNQPLIRVPGALFEPLGAALQFPADYSAIAAPLRVGDQPLGVLMLAHRAAGRYGSEAMAMTAAFASSAAVAIENARLYEEAQEQAWVSTVLLQVANATQTITDLNELLATVIHITPMLAGVKACLLYILDEEGNFAPAAASGLNAEQQMEFERWRFAPGDVAALDRLLVDRAPVFLHGGQDDSRLTSILTNEEGDQPNHLGLTVLVPMLARGEVLGAFLVDYNIAPAAVSGKSLEAFFDERLAILQGIAHQTAIAVDNINLLKSQKEEAYVSVALLQVAQAVVSSNDLAEALGSIVRITPILVGVKRALIYLWDEAQKTFRLSQAYGVARAAATPAYALGEFPLLDAVLIEDSLLAHPLWSELSAAEDAPEVWTYLPAPDMDKVNEYLENAACLLLAFPLSVKGKVLGIFLVEEPEPAPGAGLSGGNTNRRLRNKRLEIITGISQQAALAIENDLLQREMVERERLEREMQLARDIQRTFLPQTVPELPGWDLKVRWLTAREVGGDFYDYFELPGDRFGLVIADAADKGMPAALYMTLVRTLLRAIVKEVASPARALERANNVIVPDAQSGMFVTIFYAVLDLNSGRLDYANAGHNPPLLARPRSGKIERLVRGGMAIGVEAEAPILEDHAALDEGDFLILYTDGVTESFSPQGDPFGEDRLRLAIEEIMAGRSSTTTEPPSAQDVLDGIEGAVWDFIAQTPLSDDLTLLVLQRKAKSA